MDPPPPAEAPPLHPVEAEIMDEIWQRGEATVREVLEALNARASHERAYTTVMTTMRKLHDKGALERRRSGRSDVYRAALTREQHLDARAQVEVGAVIDQYGQAALTHFARALADLDPERRDELNRLAKDDK